MKKLISNLISGWKNFFYCKKRGGLDKKILHPFPHFRFPKRKQLKYLFRSLDSRERSIIKILLIIIFLSTAWLAVRFYFFRLETVPKQYGEYTEGIVGSLQYVNPALAPANEVDMDVSRLVFSGLFKYDKENKLVPDLAGRYEVNAAQTEYTFYLRNDVVWHDGEKFSADDVIFTLQTVQNSDFKSPLWITFQEVLAEKVDQYAVKFTLKEPFSPFLSTLTFGILPQHVWKSVSAVQFGLAEYNFKPVGTGPFKFVSLIKDKKGIIKSYTLERNKKYYGREPYLNKIIFKFFPSFDEAIKALRDKTVEGLGYLPRELKEKLNDLNQSGQLKFYSLYLSQYAAVFFNQTKNEALAEKEVRYALAYAIDKERILKEALQNEGKIIDGPILPGFPGYDQNVKKYEFNPTKAEEILDGAKWAKKEGSATRAKDDKELKIVLTTVEREENRKVAEIVKEEWEKIGVKTELNFVPGDQIQPEAIKPRNYEALLFGEIVGLDPDPYPFWHSSQIDNPGLNLSRFNNRKADNLLDDARKTNDLEIRTQKYAQFQNIIVDELPAIFLYNPSYTYAVGKKIKGIDAENISVPSDRFANIENWYVKTKKSVKK